MNAEEAYVTFDLFRDDAEIAHEAARVQASLTSTFLSPEAGAESRAFGAAVRAAEEEDREVRVQEPVAEAGALALVANRQRLLATHEVAAAAKVEETLRRMADQSERMREAVAEAHEAFEDSPAGRW